MALPSMEKAKPVIRLGRPRAVESTAPSPTAQQQQPILANEVAEPHEQSEEAAALLAVSLLQRYGHGLVMPRPPSAVALLHYQRPKSASTSQSPKQRRRIHEAKVEEDHRMDAVASPRIEMSPTSMRILQHLRAVDSGIDDTLVQRGLLRMASRHGFRPTAAEVDDSDRASWKSERPWATDCGCGPQPLHCSWASVLPRGDDTDP